MSTTSVYRENAEHCLRMAHTTSDEGDRPFWLSMALSWMHLAEHSGRRRGDLEDACASGRRHLS
jgi:hypothetical protein